MEITDIEQSTKQSANSQKQPRGRGKGRPFVAGQSGNPNGRPKSGDTLIEALKNKIDKDKLAEALLSLVNKGYFPAIKYAYDRIAGTPIATMNSDTGLLLGENANKVDYATLIAKL